MYTRSFTSVGERKRGCITITVFLNIQFQKNFGVYKHHLCVKHEKLLRGFDDEFYVPHSRYTEERKEDILTVPELTILAEAEGDARVYAIANLQNANSS